MSGHHALMSITEVALLAEQKIAVIQLDGTKRITTAVFAAVLGVFFIYTAAFSQSMTLHNAAHDTRHAIATPCH
ncbi:MAG: CbtB-domain containing protein [Salaquimonas sp.]|jgi:cobalt transporter subunit CbtB|nr:CbtB-domain containing protein [Salaquimonas sp.]